MTPEQRVQFARFQRKWRARYDAADLSMPVAWDARELRLVEIVASMERMIDMEEGLGAAWRALPVDRQREIQLDWVHTIIRHREG